MATPGTVARIRQIAARQPDHTAISFGPQRWSYGQLTSTVDDCRAQLTRTVDTTHATIAMAAHKTPQRIALAAAAIELGHSLLLLSPELGTDMFDHLVERAGCTHTVDIYPRDGRITATTNGFRHDPDQRQNLILATSGSTGRPKLVPLGPGAVDAFTDWCTRMFDLGPTSRVWSYAPLNFDLSLLDVWASLAAGAEVVALTADEGSDGATLARLLQDAPPTVLQSVPLLHRLVHPHPVTPIRSTRHVVVTGEPFVRELADQLAHRFPDAAIHNVYGSTETNDSLLHTVTAADHDRPHIPVGRPLPGVAVVLLDGAHAVIDGPGEGELVVSTPFQSGRYRLAEPDGAFGPWNPREPGRTYFRTGDHARRDAAGVHHLLGRRDHLVKVRGVRTNTIEVESVLAAAPDVAEAAVVATPHATEGHRLHAFVVAGPDVDRLSVRGHLARHLPRTALPATFTFLESPLPRTPSGKTDRQRLLSYL
ncbi:AMP-binding protein [Nocardia sp. BMG111209]|uniref:AMP-binding protein n=1 Tax=Nocardia sp. BMG111209 TaxID=1160137 RepID=UPI00036C4CFD|nr:AMP-binding protein [Nocardia sp. BMG111209]